MQGVNYNPTHNIKKLSQEKYQYMKKVEIVTQDFIKEDSKVEYFAILKVSLMLQEREKE